MIYFITGGERSGKSRYAQQLALELSDAPVYVATSRIWDKDFAQRVQRHKNERDERWTNIEEEKYLSKINLCTSPKEPLRATSGTKNKVAVVDCITLWLTNFYTDTHYKAEESLKQAQAEFEKLAAPDCTLIIISNEIGMGVHAETEIGRKFVELQGWMNQYIAAKAGKVVFMVSGIPITIKG